jgi:predicted RecA/RadA family phage recombinase
MAQTQQALFSHGLQEMIDYTPSGSVAAGEVVLFGSGLRRLVGIAVEPMVADRVGELVIAGIFQFKKKANSTFSRGDVVGWDTGNDEAVVSGDGALDAEIALCVEDAAAGDDFVLAKLVQSLPDAVS